MVVIHNIYRVTAFDFQNYFSDIFKIFSIPLLGGVRSSKTAIKLL